MEELSTNAAERFACTHGGPGEVEASKKAVFVESCNVTTGKVHKALLLRAPKQELIAAELIAVEEMISSSDGIRSMVDDSLMRLFFSLAASDLLKAKVEEARMNARLGLYIASIYRWEVLTSSKSRISVRLWDRSRRTLVWQSF